MAKRGITALPLSVASLFALACGESPSNEADVGETGAGDGDGDGDQLLPCGGRPTSGSKPGPPTLLGATVIDDLVIELSFSEPIASVDEVDPAAFRISVGYVYDYYEPGQEPPDPSTGYWDPYYWSGGDGRTEVVELSCVEDDPNALRLRLERFEVDDFCPYVNAVEYSYMLLPHFDAESGAITDIDGEPLDSFGAEWVTFNGSKMLRDGAFPDYPAPKKTPCDL